MFNSKISDPVFEPDGQGLFVATMDANPRDPLVNGHNLDMTFRLIGRKRQEDGTWRLVVISPAGQVREVTPDEPHRVLTLAETREFDLRAWQADQRQAARDAERSDRLNAQRQGWRNRLRRSLVVSLGPTYGPRDLGLDGVLMNQEGRRLADELIADGLARSLDDQHIVTAQPVEVDLSNWQYTGAEGRATFTPTSVRGRRILTHRTPVGDGASVAPTGRYMVIGEVMNDDGMTWTAYLAAGRAELVGPGVSGVWEEGVAADVRAWRAARVSEDESRMRHEEAGRMRESLREQLTQNYAVTPRGDLARQVCEEMKREGLCYEVEGSFILARAV